MVRVLSQLRFHHFALQHTPETEVAAPSYRQPSPELRSEILRESFSMHHKESRHLSILQKTLHTSRFVSPSATEVPVEHPLSKGRSENAQGRRRFGQLPRW